MILRLVFMVGVFLMICTISVAQDSIRIYSEAEALAMGLSIDEIPVMYRFSLDANEKKPAVLIFPGGGYRILSLDYEGFQVAKWYNERGVNAFVLKYRLGKFDGSGFKHPDMLNDGIRAMQLIRSNADNWKIDAMKVGVMGFSAGGHMAAMLSTHFKDADLASENPLEQVSSLPNFCVLAYPVISMNDKYTHWGSRRFLLGPVPNQVDMDYLSAQDQVKSQTPPTFIFQTSDDKSVPVQNAVHYYLALREEGIPAELHIFEHGPHGVGLASGNERLSVWTELLEQWLTNWGVFPAKK